MSKDSEPKRSRRYGKRFSSPYSKWPCGGRRNPTRPRRHKRGKGSVIIVKGKA